MEASVGTVKSGFGAIAAVLVAGAVLVACGTSATVPPTLPTIEKQLVPASAVGDGYTVTDIGDSGMPADQLSFDSPQNSGSISTPCLEWLRSYWFTKAGGVASTAFYNANYVPPSSGGYTVYEWIGSFDGDGGLRALAAYARDAAACPTLPIQWPNETPFSFKIKRIAAPSFGADTVAIEWTSVQNGSTYTDEQVIGVFGQQDVAIDLGEMTSSASAVSSAIDPLLAKAAAPVGTPAGTPQTPAPTATGDATNTGTASS